MALALSVILTVFIIAYRIMDGKGKINRVGIGRGVFYQAMIILGAILLCAGIGYFWGNADITGTGEDLDDARIMLIQIFIQMLFSAAVTVTCITGCVGVLRSEMKREDGILGDSVFHSSNCVLKLSLAAACLSALCGLLSIIFCIKGAVSTIDIFMEILPMLIAGIILGLFTFGIAFIIVMLGIPLYIVSEDIDVFCDAITGVSYASVLGLTFGVLYIVSVIFAVPGYRRLRRNDLITKKQSIIFSILSFIPGVNIAAGIHMYKIINKTKA
ncbi:MAG: hypothetical protein ACI4KF_01085 [Huintestinicola sp.]